MNISRAFIPTLLCLLTLSFSGNAVAASAEVEVKSAMGGPPSYPAFSGGKPQYESATRTTSNGSSVTVTKNGNGYATIETSNGGSGTITKTSEEYATAVFRTDTGGTVESSVTKTPDGLSTSTTIETAGDQLITINRSAKKGNSDASMATSEAMPSQQAVSTVPPPPPPPETQKKVAPEDVCVSVGHRVSVGGCLN